MSQSVYSLIPGVLGRDQERILYAEVTTPAPTAFSDPLWIILPDWATDWPIQILHWPACHGNALPLPGAAALLIDDSRGVRRCVWWDGPMVFGTQDSLTYYLTTTASDLAGGRLALTTTPPGAESFLSYTNVQNGQVLQDHVTAVGSPGVTFLPAGQYEYHAHGLQTAGNQTVQLFAKFWEVLPGPTYVGPIGTTQTSPPLTGFDAEYRLFFENPNVYALSSSASRIAVQLLAFCGGGGGANVRLDLGGTTEDSHVVLPTTLRAAASGPASRFPIRPWGTAAR